MPSRPVTIFRHLHQHYGKQHWWPADSPFEVMVGAILTQNTAWTNVERALKNLVQADCLNVQAILRLPEHKLAVLLKPSGYFNIKAKRLQNFCKWYHAHGEYQQLKTWATDKLRVELLKVNGIGEETADDMLLYAFDRPVFVIDAYTRRMFQRLGQVKADLSYQALQAHFHTKLEADVALYNEYHALIVKHAKDVCKVKPKCVECCLRRMCLYENERMKE